MRIKDLQDFCNGKDPEADVALWRWHGNGHSLTLLNPGRPDKTPEGVYTVLLMDGPALTPIPRTDYLIRDRYADWTPDVITLTAHEAWLAKRLLE